MVPVHGSVEPSVDDIHRDYVVGNLEFMIVILLGALGYLIFDSRRRRAEGVKPKKPPKVIPCSSVPYSRSPAPEAEKPRYKEPAAVSSNGGDASEAAARPDKASPQKGNSLNLSSGNSGRAIAARWREARAARDLHLQRFRACAAEKDVEGILRTLDIMAQQSLPPDDEVFHAIYCRFPSNLQSSGVNVLRIFKALLDGGFKPSRATLTQVTELLAKTDHWEPALEFLRSTGQCFEIPADAIQYAKLCLTCETSGKLTAAKKVHEAMVEDLGEAAIEEKLTGTRFDRWIKAPAARTGKVADLVVQSFDQVDSQGDSLQWKRLIVQFAVANGVDRVQLDKLRLPKKQLQWIIDQHFLLQPDGEEDSATKLLMQYVREAAAKPKEFWITYPTFDDIKKRLSWFIELNGLDRKCREMLKTLPLDLAQKVMDHEYLVKVDPTRGTASSKVIGHIMRFRRLRNGSV